MAAQNGHTPMPATDLRRRVRRITAATVGVAALTASALTVNFAWATDDPAAGTSATDSNQAGSTSADGTRAPAAPEQNEADGENEGKAQAPAAQPSITAPSAPRQAPLAAPRQAPLAGSGRSHTQSGGS